MSVKITTLISGVRQWNQALKTMDVATRDRLRNAVQQTTEAVGMRARTNVPVSGENSRKAKGRPGPGELRDTIRTAYALDGLTGYVMAGFGKLPRKSRATRAPKLGPMRLGAFQRHQKRMALRAQRELGVYAMVINYGSPGRGIAASRYMDRAKESEREAHIARIRAALSQAASTAAQGVSGAAA